MLKENILKTIKKYNLIEKGDNIVIGVSGGPDSICLLHVLYLLKEQLNFDISVAHINHMLREEADMETEYVKEFCKILNIQCFVKKEDIEKKSKEEKIGTEEAGRNVRYEFFEEVLQKVGGNKIATAHNSNDKAETVVMNILRGTGISGLKGIEAIRDGKYIRPLIETERKEIEAYCEAHNLNPKFDKTNEENIYNRNKVRNELIPYIQKEFNPNFLKTINRLSEVATEENEYLNKVTEEKFNEICIKNSTSIELNLKKFNNLELVIKRRVILYTINKLTNTTLGIEKVNIDDIIKMCEKNIGNKYLMPTKNIKVGIKNKKIFIEAKANLP